MKYIFDILIIGSGVAALKYGLEVAKEKNLKIGLVTKKSLFHSNSSSAQGGIAAISFANDSLALHLEDTSKASAGKIDINAATKILKKGPHVIEELTELGVKFATSNGEFKLTKEGGHTRRRVFYVGDKTGLVIVNSLITKLRERTNIHIFEYHLAFDLIRHNDKIIGAYILNLAKNQVSRFIARTTVLATGGGGKAFRYTTNLGVATGDGIAMAKRVGLKLSHLEFYQFHPTLLYHPKVNNLLLTEALRGEGGYLLDGDKRERFMFKHSPIKMELDTRDIVARAIFSEIEKSKKDYVYLDIRHHSRDFLKERFPTIYHKLLKLGIEMSSNLIPVVPGAHYMCGGIKAEVDGTTNLDGLYAIGEVACSGMHGANRLASNSLLEAIVMADFCARKSLSLLPNIKIPPLIEITKFKKSDKIKEQAYITAHWRGLRNEMSSYAGIIRSTDALQDLLQLIEVRKQIIDKYYASNRPTLDLIELRNVIHFAKLITKSAIKNKKSCGCHWLVER